MLGGVQSVFRYWGLGKCVIHVTELVTVTWVRSRDRAWEKHANHYTTEEHRFKDLQVGRMGQIGGRG